jgi:pyrroline-5-carboxylate reductase
MDTIGFIGSGNMAQAIIKGILSSGLYKAGDIMASDVQAEQLGSIAKTYKIKTTSNNDELVNYAKVILICVKPQSVKQMLDGIEGKMKDNTLVISIAAGITTTCLAKRLGNCRIIRAMPNTPAMVGQGATAIFSANADTASMEYAVKLFSAVGRAVVVPSEDLIDAVTAVSGSGPAYFFLLMEQMIEAAVKLGLDKKTAVELVLQTAKGASLLADSQHPAQSPSQLRDKVTSPGGTTQAALKVFDEHQFDVIVQKALTAARDRSRQLAQ